MKLNMGKADRTIRVIIGLILLVLGIFVAKTTFLTVILIVLGLVMLLTSAVGLCPAYLPFHIDTGKSKEKQA